MGRLKKYQNKFLKSDPQPTPSIDQLVTQIPAGPRLPPDERPFPGALLPLLPSIGMAWGRFGLRGGPRGHLPLSLVCPPGRPIPQSTTTCLTRGVSHAGSRLLAVSENCAGGGFLRRAPSTKIPRWDRKFGHQHFFTKTDPIRARRVCKKGPLKARGRLGTEGRPLLLAKVVFSGGARSSVTGTPSRPGALPPSG
jgi:hypothetical protein